MHLSIIIPAYNEALRIEKTLYDVDSYLKKKAKEEDFNYEIIVVNDGSSDETSRVVEKAMKDINNLKLIHNQVNNGKGWVVRQGMLAARGDYRLFMDADNSTTINHIESFFNDFKKGNDIVIGSRRISGSSIDVPQTWFRDFLGSLFRVIVRTMVPVGVIDSQNGFKMFTGWAAEEVFRRQRTFSWAFDVEILAIARLYGLKVKEAPIRWINDGRSHVTPRGMVNMLFEVAQIRINLWLGAYAEVQVAEETPLA